LQVIFPIILTLKVLPEGLNGGTDNAVDTEVTTVPESTMVPSPTQR